MKTFFKLLVAAIVINGCVRAGFAAMHYYQFKEAAQQAVLFGADSTPADIQTLIVQRARELSLPIDPKNVIVGRSGGRTWADASYSQSVEIFPGQKYPVDLAFSVEGYSMVLGPSASK